MRITPDSSPEATIAEALLTAPGWARIGITAPSEWVREEAARELARAVLEGGERPPEASTEDQLGFPL